MSAIVSSLLVTTLLVASVPVAAVTSNATTIRFNFLHAFTSDPTKSVVTTVQGLESTIADFKPQLILVTTPGSLSTNSSTNGTPSTDLNQTYTFDGGNRVGFTSNQWQVDRDVLLSDSIGTRLKSSDAPTTDVCAVVAPNGSMNSLEVIELATRVDKFCASWGIVLLGFAVPLSDDLAQYLEGKTAINGQYAPRAMNEFVAFTLQTSNNSRVDAAASKNRLFVHFPLAACAETASSMARAAETLATESAIICVGPNCTTCGQPLVAGDSATMGPHGSSVKRGLVVLFACGTFLIGSALVFYVFFRKQFFVPSESTKPEKELTSDLAYVLRM